MKQVNSPAPIDLFDSEELETRFEMAPWIEVEVPIPCGCQETETIGG